MLLSILFIIVVGLNAYAVYLNRECRAQKFNIYVLFFLFICLLRFLIGYFISIFYSQYLYKSTAFPISLLYGVFIYFSFNLSMGKVYSNVLKHLIPFVLGMVGYFGLVLTSSWRYLYYHEYYIGVYIVSIILFITYISVIGLKFYAGPNYSLKLFFQRGKLFLIPLCILSLLIGMTVIKVAKRGDVEMYLAFNFLFYILTLLAIIQFSLTKRFKVGNEARVNEEKEHYDYLKTLEINKSPTQTKVSFILEKELEISYRLEIEKFIAAKAYLDVDLNKDSFCKKISIPKAHVSPFLKKIYGKSFNGFINDLRLSYAAKELIREELIYTIDDLSFVCGFRSRASFYRNFIAVFGCSPHQYRGRKVKPIC